MMVLRRRPTTMVGMIYLMIPSLFSRCLFSLFDSCFASSSLIDRLFNINTNLMTYCVLMANIHLRLERKREGGRGT